VLFDFLLPKSLRSSPTVRAPSPRSRPRLRFVFLTLLLFSVCSFRSRRSRSRPVPSARSRRTALRTSVHSRPVERRFGSHTTATATHAVQTSRQSASPCEPTSRTIDQPGNAIQTHSCQPARPRAQPLLCPIATSNITVRLQYAFTNLLAQHRTACHAQLQAASFQIELEPKEVTSFQIECTDS
jgi:hypothetical protein